MKNKKTVAKSMQQQKGDTPFNTPELKQLLRRFNQQWAALIAAHKPETLCTEKESTSSTTAKHKTS